MMMGAYKLIDDSVSMQNIILKMGVVLMSQKSANIVEIGNFLLNSGCDDLADAGFWLYDYSTLDIYFSPKLKEALGSNTISTYADLARFANNEDLISGHKKVNELVKNKSEMFFDNEIRYTRTDGSMFTVTCNAAVFFLFGQPKIVLGTNMYI